MTVASGRGGEWQCSRTRCCEMRSVDGVSLLEQIVRGKRREDGGSSCSLTRGCERVAAIETGDRRIRRSRFAVADVGEDGRLFGLTHRADSLPSVVGCSRAAIGRDASRTIPRAVVANGSAGTAMCAVRRRQVAQFVVGHRPQPRGQRTRVFILRESQFHASVHSALEDPKLAMPCQRAQNGMGARPCQHHQADNYTTAMSTSAMRRCNRPEIPPDI